IVTAMCFFFSSRRRHTRSYGDWSSDVCSSDLGRWSSRAWLYRIATNACLDHLARPSPRLLPADVASAADPDAEPPPVAVDVLWRSEERRVGKGCGWRGVLDREESR